MHNPSIRKCLSISIFVLMFSLILTAPVFAEGEVLPEPTETDASAGAEEQPAQEDLPAEEPGSEDPIPEETPPEEDAAPPDDVVEPSAEATEQPAEITPAETAPAEESPAEEAPAEEPVQEPETIPEALAEADLELAGADGESLDMACEDTAEALSIADPYFMVGTQVYRWLPDGGDCSTYLAAGENCTTSLTPIQAAIDYIEANGTIPSDRKIYVESDSYIEDVTIDGTKPNLSTINGLIGVYDPDTEDKPDITGNITINDLTSGFTLQGFTLYGALDLDQITGTITIKDTTVNNASGDGIQITNAKSAVVIENVDASENSGNGLYLDNTSSGNPYNITIKNSYFNDNDDGLGNVHGAQIITLGKVAIDGITASRNRGSGINITGDFSSLSLKNAVLSNNNANPEDSTYGVSLYAASTMKAPITLENVYVLNDQDNESAIQLITSGNVIIRNIYVNDNNGAGLKVDNTAGTGYVKIYDSQFNRNQGTGAEIDSKGTIYISSVQAMDSVGGSGMIIDNCQFDGGVCTGVGTVTILSPKSYGAFGANNFSDNFVDGLQITSGKAIKLYNVIADGNGNTGIDLQNNLGSGGVTIKKNIPSTDFYTFYNTASDNIAGYGLYILSNSTINVEYFEANNNGSGGGYFKNDGAVSNPGIIIKYSTFNENAGAGPQEGNGIYISSKGNTALTNVSASTNAKNGVYALSPLNGVGGFSAIGTKGYTCEFNNNTNAGLWIDVKGTILIREVEANENGERTYLVNHTAASAKKVTITNATFNESDFGWGLNVISLGSISLNNVSASGNPGGGAQLDNSTYDGSGSVSVKYCYFDDNAGTAIDDFGLEVLSNKNITLYSVSASSNGNVGAYLDNCHWDGSSACQGSGSVSIKSGKGVRNTFNNNEDTGLFVLTTGTVTIYYIDASDNGGIGLQIDADNNPTSGSVNISASKSLRNMFMNNGGNGMEVSTRGNISIRYTDVYNSDGDYGAALTNDASAYARSVSIKDSTFNRNTGTGLYVRSNGAITLQGVEASDNSIIEGVTLSTIGKQEVLSAAEGNDSWSFDGTLGDPFQVTVTSMFFDPFVAVYSSTGELIWSDDNGGGGTTAEITGVTLPDTGTYTIVISAVYGGSGAYGMNLNGSDGVEFDYSGAYLQNSTGTAPVKILYSSLMGFGGRFWNNDEYGLYIASHGAVTLNRMDVGYNGNAGVTVNNVSEYEQQVSIKTATIEGNVNYGVLVLSRGNITLSKVSANFNQGNGAELNNSTALRERALKITSSFFNDNFIVTSGDAGLEIHASGAVTLSSVEANNNDKFGAYVKNAYGSYSGNVTVTGKNNTFDDNVNKGLYIESYGNVNLYNFSASNNGDDGVYIKNGFDGFEPKNVKLNNTQRRTQNLIQNNTDYGLYIYSFGNITVNKVYCDNNLSNQITHGTATEVKKITITNSIFNNSTAGSGLYIPVAYGPVLISNVDAVGNTNPGLRVENTSASGEDITLKNITVHDNDFVGIWVESAGKVTADRITAFGNGDDGVYIDNSSGIETVTVSNSTFYSNQDKGLYIKSPAMVTLKLITTAHNATNGIKVEGGKDASPTFISVSLYKVISLQNHQTGIYLNNALDVTAIYTTVIGNGTGKIADNDDGLYIIGNGTTPITIKSSTFLGNYGSGVDLQSTIATPTIVTTTIFGNDIDNDLPPGEDAELYIH